MGGVMVPGTGRRMVVTRHPARRGRRAPREWCRPGDVIDPYESVSDETSHLTGYGYEG